MKRIGLISITQTVGPSRTPRITHNISRR